MYQGEPTVGNQSKIPLSRRVQLAVLAHIRHQHTRYDQLLRETSWMNARKVVEPVCLDIILKWRGNEENGRDQMDEILREIVIITDSESDDEVVIITDSESEDEIVVITDSENEGEARQSSSESDRSSEERETTSRISSEEIFQWRPKDKINYSGSETIEHATNQCQKKTSDRLISVGSNTNLTIHKRRDRAAQRGFKRYQAAWEEALKRQKDPIPHANYLKSSTNPSATQYAISNQGPYPQPFTHKPSTSDTTHQNPHDHLESRRRHYDDYYILPSVSYPYSLFNCFNACRN